MIDFDPPDSIWDESSQSMVPLKLPKKRAGKHAALTQKRIAAIARDMQRTGAIEHRARLARELFPKLTARMAQQSLRTFLVKHRHEICHEWKMQRFNIT